MSQVRDPKMAELANAQNLIEKLMASAKTATVEYGEAKIDGDKATLAVTTDGEEEAVDFVREGGGWKVSLPISDGDMANARKTVELAKKMPQGMLEGLQSLGEKMKEDLEKK